MKNFATALALSALVTGAAIAGPQGVTEDKITLGSYTDLSGPLAVWGVPEANGLRMRVDEINAAGGIHGRQLEIVIEDTQYQVPRAIQAANKLLRRDRVFAMVGALGTPMNLAVMPQQLDAGVPNLFPMTAAPEMAEPLHQMKYAFFRNYTEQFRAAVAYFHDNGGFVTPCVSQIANEAGESMTLGVEQQLHEYGMEIVAKTEHSATETDMVSSVTTLKNAGCDIVFNAGSVKDTILTVATSKKLGFEPIFVTGMVPYMDAVAKADVFRLTGGSRQKYFRCGGVGILFEEVVLHLPRIIIAQPVGENDLVQRLLEEPVFPVLAPRARQLKLVKDPKAHGCPLPFVFVVFVGKYDADWRECKSSRVGMAKPVTSAVGCCL